MTDKKSRRVLIINNIQSEIIDQAIFILKSSPQTRKTDKDISTEAQLIIDNYVQQVERSKTSYSSGAKPSRNRKIPLWIKFLMTTAAVAFLIFYTFHSL